MADHKIDGNDGAGNVDLIRRIDAMQACQVAPSDEWSKATKGGYNQAATDCAMAILRVAPAPAANDEVASYKMAAMECELECKALRAQRDDAWVRADVARDKALVEAKAAVGLVRVPVGSTGPIWDAMDAIDAIRDKTARVVTVDIDALAYRFWSIHPKDIPDPVGMPEGYKGGARAWMYATEIREVIRTIAGGGDE